MRLKMESKWSHNCIEIWWKFTFEVGSKNLAGLRLAWLANPKESQRILGTLPLVNLGLQFAGGLARFVGLSLLVPESQRILEP